ncbi:MAG: hypothetical protein WCR04_05820 [Fibrobacteraceae bacterium]
MLETIDLETLLAIVKTINLVKDAKHDEDSVSFEFSDKDGDSIPVFVKLIDEEKISVMVPIKIPESHLLSAMFAGNVYNSQPETHGMFAYASKIDEDRCCIVLETDLLIRGGVSETNVRQYLRLFVDGINRFETIMLQGIKELGPDSNFVKDSDGSSVWEAIGAFAGGFLDGYTNT